MTQTNDPPLVASVALIPDSDEKADLDAPSSQSGKLVVSQAPNITITSTSVVADQAERLALDPQEGDIAIQQDTTESFIFTGGSNQLANWQLVQFDAVGGIAGEDIAPRDIDGRNVGVTDIDTDTITAANSVETPDLTANDVTINGLLNGADTSGAVAGEALTSDGQGGFGFASVGGDALTLMSEFLTQANMSQIASSQSDMQDVINTGLMQNVAASQIAMQEVTASQTAMQEVAASQNAMQEVTASQIAMQEVTASQTAMQEVANSQTAMQEVADSSLAFNQVATSATARGEIEGSSVAINVLNSFTTSFSDSDGDTNFDTFGQVEPLTDANGVWVEIATTDGGGTRNPGHRRNVIGGTVETTTGKFVFDVEHTSTTFSSASRTATTSGQKYRP